jgi:hypothetical protein
MSLFERRDIVFGYRRCRRGRGGSRFSFNGPRRALMLDGSNVHGTYNETSDVLFVLFAARLTSK